MFFLNADISGRVLRGWDEVVGGLLLINQRQLGGGESCRDAARILGFGGLISAEV